MKPLTLAFCRVNVMPRLLNGEEYIDTIIIVGEDGRRANTEMLIVLPAWMVCHLFIKKENPE